MPGFETRVQEKNNHATTRLSACLSCVWCVCVCVCNARANSGTEVGDDSNRIGSVVSWIAAVPDGQHSSAYVSIRKHRAVVSWIAAIAAVPDDLKPSQFPGSASVCGMYYTHTITALQITATQSWVRMYASILHINTGV